MKTFKFITLAAVLGSALFTNLALASESVGTINPSFKISKVCQDNTCSTYGQINFAPTINVNTTGAVAISITDTYITGNAYGDQVGWINMKPTGSGVTVNPNTGALGGFAYSQAGSWINFAPTGQGVSINSVGEFTGWAWVSGAYGGWLKFDCLGVGTCVKTDWRPIPNRTVVTPTPTPSTGGGGLVSAYVTISPTGSTTTIKETEIKPQPVKVVQPLTPESSSPESNTDTEGAPAGYRPPVTGGSGQSTSTEAASENVFDTNRDGTPDLPPSTIRSNGLDADYRQVFPVRTDYKKDPDCLFCIIVRHDERGVVSGGVPGDRYVLKFGFVPNSVQVPVAISKKYIPFTSPEAKTEFTHIDAVSASIAAAAGWATWRLILIRALRFLVRNGKFLK